MTALTLDRYDLKRLRALQENARISHVALPEKETPVLPPSRLP
ncbi:MAG TPA: hypothetical protein VNN09_14310 [Candidatus Competibacteraceae bacterium]|nr:hypothetical protein [Candidatus Competibacteraceae bacterium]